MKHIAVSTLILLGLSSVLLPATASAATTTFGQKILPLNCVFEEVHDGTGTLYYLTPKECDIITPPMQDGSDSTGQSHSSEHAHIPPIAAPGIPPFLTFGPVEGAKLPWQPLVSVSQDGTIDITPSGTTHAPQKAGLFSGVRPFFAHLVAATMSYRPTTKQAVVGAAGGAFFIALLLVIVA